MLGKSQKRIFLNISEGKIRKRVNGTTETFDFVEGNLEQIYVKDREFRGEKVPYGYLDISDPKTGDLYSLGVATRSGVWRSLVLSLGSKDFNCLLPLKIVPYKRGEFDKVVVYSGGTKLDWVSDLPPIENLNIDGQVIRSVARRDEFINRIVKQINTQVRIHKNLRDETDLHYQQRDFRLH